MMRSAALLAIAAAANLAAAQSNLTLFGQDYAVTRLDYSEVRWADPLAPGIDINLIEVEGAHWLGNDRLLLSMDAGDSLLTIKNWVVEVQINRDPAGAPVSLSYVRTVLANDPFEPGYGGFDLSPCGLTLNTSASGLAANGNLLIGDSEANRFVGYSTSTGSLLGAVSTPQNPSYDDLAFVPTDGHVYTIDEDGYKVAVFSTGGAFIRSFGIPGLTALSEFAVPGSPKGMTFLSDVPGVPASIRRAGGSLLVALDDNNPGLQVFDLAGNVLATEPLTDEPLFGGFSLLNQGPDCSRLLQLEAAAFDPDTGTIFLINEGFLTSCSGFFILVPNNPCPADFDGTGFVDSDDFVAFVQAFTLGCDGAGSPDPACVKSADFDGTGFVDSDDFVTFVQAFSAGC
ncbi:MAG: hypothetical protein SFY95_05910 [Planctomycetota bacterium]|nr:hypothetical protein [Planctomycetota bacterium]